MAASPTQLLAHPDRRATPNVEDIQECVKHIHCSGLAESFDDLEPSPNYEFGEQ